MSEKYNHTKATIAFAIGSIYFEDSIQEKAVGSISLKTLGECEIEVFDGEGQMPHFHIHNNEGILNTCICIYSNNYFAHGKYGGTLNAKQRKQLNEWLKQVNTKSRLGITNWEEIVEMWELANSNNCKFPESKKVKTQPRYDIMTDDYRREI